MSVDDVEESIKLFPRSTSSFRAGVRSVLAAPMVADDRAINIIRWQIFDADAYEETDLELAERVANQMAGAMANAQIFAENQRNQLGLRESETQYRERTTHQSPISRPTPPASSRRLTIGLQICSATRWKNWWADP